MSRRDPHTWASPPPLPEDPTRFRQALLYEQDRLAPVHVERAVSKIEYYPELQDATLKLLHRNPHPELIAAMAEAILGKFKEPGASPSEADRIRAIDAARAAIKAAVDHVDPTPEEPF